MQKEMNNTLIERILVVDDNTANLQLLTNLLTKHGYTVHPASAGELALEFIQSTLPDLILLDIRMPGMDGYEVCRRLKSLERTRSIPIIFISVMEDERHKAKGFQEGAVDFITKPFQPEEVLARVRTHLRLRQMTDHLEQEVAERTQELTIASQRLQQELAERKKAEEALIIAKEAAQNANRAKSDFLANMSHEIRTPLNAIKGFNKLLLDSNLSSKQKFFAESVRQASENLLLIINDILDFSKIEAVKIALDLAGFELENLLKETINMFQPTLEQKKLDLHLEISSHLPKILIGDKGKFRQVLTNLLSNAIKFTPSGSVTVRVCRHDDSTSLPQKENGLALLISVEDTGIGIKPEQLSIIFEAFVQGDSSSTKQYRGIGLGLAITKRLVETMGGSIWVESRPGVGSIFFLTARFEIGSALDIVTNEAAGKHAHLTLNPLRILLAEDDILNQKFGIEVLQRQGHTVTLANNGKEVLDLLNKETFDLILMDVSMPEMDGIEATKEIRNTTSNKDLPVIALTAHAIEGDKDRFLEVGMDGYIAKPIDVDELIEEIAKVAPRFVNRQTGTALQTNTGKPSDKNDHDQSISIDKVIPVIDIDAWRTRFSRKKDFFVELFGHFLDELPKRMTAINEAIEIGDLNRLSHLAHSFKGVAATVCASEIAVCSDRIYQAARENDLERAKSSVKELSLVLDRVRNISIADFFD
ncbi:MAG: response regulator [Deltaproteobacteria bacterium]|nr:response regulator [Deltaproteobacteria bacterium]